MTTTLKERLNIAMRHQRVNQKMLIDRSGLSRSTVSAWCTGRIHTVRWNNACALADTLGVRPEWLLSGEGAMLADSPLNKPEAQPHRLPDEPEVKAFSADLVVVQGTRISCSAGGGAFVLDQEEDPDMSCALNRAFFRVKHINPKHCRMMDVSGDSMEPSLSDGDQIVVDCSPVFAGNDAPIADGRMYVFWFDGKIYVKRLYSEHRSIRVVSDNPVVSPFMIETTDMESGMFKLIGKVLMRLTCV